MPVTSAPGLSATAKPVCCRPIPAGRYDHKTRWPRALERILNGEGEAEWRVVEEGLNGRTSSFDDPVDLDRNGLRHIVPILKSHKPLDIVIVMLGANDLKRRFNPSPYDVSQGVLNVVKAVLYSETGPENGPPKTLVICPPPLLDSPAFGDVFRGSPPSQENCRPITGRYAGKAARSSLMRAALSRQAPLTAFTLNLPPILTWPKL